MARTQRDPPDAALADEELIDMLIAVSVISKRLAEKIRQEKAQAEPS